MILICNEYFFLSHLFLSLDIATIPNSKKKIKMMLSSFKDLKDEISTYFNEFQENVNNSLIEY